MKTWTGTPCGETLTQFSWTRHPVSVGCSLLDSSHVSQCQKSQDKNLVPSDEMDNVEMICHFPNGKSTRNGESIRNIFLFFGRGCVFQYSFVSKIPGRFSAATWISDLSQSENWEKNPRLAIFVGKTWKTINFLRVPDFQTKLLPVPFCLDTYCFWMFLVRFWWKILCVFMMLVQEKSIFLAWAKFIFWLARYPHTHRIG